MQVILLDKVANLGSLGDQVTLKRAMLVTSWYHRVKLFLLPRKTLNSSKHAVAELGSQTGRMFWAQLTHVLKQSTHWAPLPSRLNLATKVNCSVPSYSRHR